MSLESSQVIYWICRSIVGLNLEGFETGWYLFIEYPSGERWLPMTTKELSRLSGSLKLREVSINLSEFSIKVAELVDV